MIAPLKKDRFGKKVRMLADIQGAGMTGFLFSPEIDNSDIQIYLDFFFKNIYPSKTLKLRRLNEYSQENIYLSNHFNNNSRSITKCVGIYTTGNSDSLIKNLSKSVRQNIRTAYNRTKRDNIDLKLKIWMPAQIPSKEEQKLIMNLYLSRLFGKYRTAKNNPLSKFIHFTFIRPIKFFIYKHLKHDTLSLFSGKNKNTFHAVLFDGSSPMALLSGFMTEDKKKIVIPRLAINEQYSFYSPGYLLLKEIIEKCPFDYIDLSRGTEKYKYDMGGKEYNTVSWTINPTDRHETASRI